MTYITSRWPGCARQIRNKLVHWPTRCNPLQWLFRSGLCLLYCFSPSAKSAAVFEAQTFHRGSGAPVLEVIDFAAPNPSGTFQLKLYNGGLQDDETEGEPVSASEIHLNGALVIGPENFNENTDFITTEISLRAENSLSVELRGKPGGRITLEIIEQGDTNNPPVADAGPDQNLHAGSTVLLDGSGSLDPDGDAINFQWTFEAKPAGSSSVLIDAQSPNASFQTDEPGTYIVRLSVSDGINSSATDTATIIVTPDPHADPDGDGLTNAEEQDRGTDPDNPDSDDDGFNDGTEVNAGSDPLDPDSIPYSDVPLSLVISEPGDGALINADYVWLIGQLTGPANAGVNANGEVATVMPGTPDATFYVRVPLDPGLNTLEITATDIEGNQVNISMSVTSAGAADLVLLPDPLSGFAPVTVDFTLDNNANLTLQQLELDYDGDGIIDMNTQDLAEPLTGSFSAPGLYTANLTATDDTGISHQTSALIIIQDTAGIEQLLQGVWLGLNDALLAGDTDTALKFITQDSQEIYAQLFTELGAEMPSILASLSEVAPVTIGNDTGSYALLSGFNDQWQVYMVNFTRGADGVWRIDSF